MKINKLHLYTRLILEHVIKQLSRIAYAFMLMILINSIIYSDSVFEKKIFLFAGLLLLLRVVFLLAMASSFWYLKSIASNWILHKRDDLVDSILHFPVNFLRNKGSGYYTSRTLNDTSVAVSLNTESPKLAIDIVVSVILCSIFLISVNYILAIVMFIVLIGYGLISYHNTKTVTALSGVALERSSVLRQNMLSGIKSKDSSQYYNAKSYFMDSISRDYDNSIFSSLKLQAYSQYKSFALDFLPSTILPAAIIGIAGYGVMQGTFTVGGLIAFRYVYGRMFTSASSIINLIINTRIYNSANQRVTDLLSSDTECQRKESNVNPIDSSIVIDQLQFSYPGSDEPVLKGLDLNINEGESIGLVGKSGAGKTTLINLILGFYEAEKGQILAGNSDIRNCTLSSIRRHIGIVPQNPYIFNQSIKENILMGRDLSEDRLLMILESSGVSDIISKLPNGIRTCIGEDGYTLSGGQRKRIAIARALVSEPQIVILDEATSELDSESEQSIRQAINEMMQNRTVIVIAHRLSTIKNLDQIYLLHQGRIAASGKHSELLSSSDLYRELFLDQAL